MSEKNIDCNTGDIVKLKGLWKNYNETWNAEEVYEKFIEQYPKDNISKLTLDEYTNVNPKANKYFTYWIERETEKLGKFRTASSFAYGIYKVNIESLKNGTPEQKKEAESINKPDAFNEKEVYRSLDQKSKKEFKDKYITKEQAKTYFKDKVLPLLKKLAMFEDINDIKPLDINFARKAAYLYNVDKLIPIYKKEVIESIANFFDVCNDVNLNSYKATEPILEKIKEVFDIKGEINIALSQKIASFLWKYFGKSFPFESKNIIFYGTPGTGKTYTVKNSIEQRVIIEGGDYNKNVIFMQFHPSFGYEDFIEGLKPQLTNGQIALELKNGVFKEFCKIAMETLKTERKDRKEDAKLTKYYFVADEINRAELSAVFGELLVCLEEDKRVDFDNNGNIKDTSMIVQTQYSYLDTENNAVLWIDKKAKFGIPANIYFIGTMNDIDRSIDSFDLALRRRFLWERMDCDYEVIANDDNISTLNDVESYVKRCKALNEYISKNLGLGKSYEIGHSYFLKIQVHNQQISNKSYQFLLDKTIAPLLKEYLRAEYSENEIETQLKCMNKIFTEGQKSK